MNTDQFLLALQAYREVRSELEQETSAPSADSTESPPTAPALSLPANSLLFGLGEDSLPVLFDLSDSPPGALLVAGDAGCGKTAFLQSLARSSDLSDPGDIFFGALTLFPEEWENLEMQSNCLGIWPSEHPATFDFLARLIDWGEAFSESHQTILLLLDGLEALADNDFEIQHSLRWLLMRGPEAHIWPVATVNTRQISRLKTWQPYFQTRILGHVRRPADAALLTADPTLALNELQPGFQFVYYSPPDPWFRFWLPPLK